MRLNAWHFGVVCVTTMAGAGACRSESTGSSDPDAGARHAVFVPAEDVTLARQFYSGIDARERLVVQSAAEWSSLWERIHGRQAPVPPIVQPDFNTEVVLVATMGEKPSGGYTITIDSITRHERGSIVYVTEKSPSQSCFTPAVITQAVHAIRAPRTDGTTWWRERTAVETCDAKLGSGPDFAESRSGPILPNDLR
jgi:hypothetical protein